LKMGLFGIKDNKRSKKVNEKRQVIKDCFLEFGEGLQKNDIEVIKSCLNKANKKGVTLNLNDDILGGRSLFSFAIMQDNLSMITLLIEYAQNNDIILDINKKDEDGQYPFFYTVI